MSNRDRTHLATHYPESRFGGFTDVDGTVLFYTRVRALLRAGDTVLDAGCGVGHHTQDSLESRRRLRDLRDRAGAVIGIDLEADGCANPTLTEFRLIEDPTEWPVQASSVDLVLADCVVEHVQEPTRFFEQCARVLRNGGYLCLRTPNLRSYFGLISKLIPDRWHGELATRVQAGRHRQSVFKTYYRCNTVRRLRSQLRETGFEAAVYAHDSEPAYLSFSGVAYTVGVLYQRYAPRSLGVTLFAFGRLRGS